MTKDLNRYFAEKAYSPEAAYRDPSWDGPPSALDEGHSPLRPDPALLRPKPVEAVSGAPRRSLEEVAAELEQLHDAALLLKEQLIEHCHNVGIHAYAESLRDEPVERWYSKQAKYLANLLENWK